MITLFIMAQGRAACANCAAVAVDGMGYGRLGFETGILKSVMNAVSVARNANHIDKNILKVLC
jgi:hypothetical protein